MSKRSWLQESAHRRSGSGPHKTLKPAHEHGDWRQDMYTEKLAAVCLLTRDDGKVLAISRGENLENLGLPGGKVEVGESRKHAALRELEEETGFKARMSDATLIFEGMNHDVYVTAFRVSKWSGGLMESHREGTPMWVNPEELLSPRCSYREFNLSVLKTVE